MIPKISCISYSSKSARIAVELQDRELQPIGKFLPTVIFPYRKLFLKEAKGSIFWWLETLKMFKSRETQRAAALRAWWKGDKLPEKYIWQIGQIYWRKSDKYIWQLREILDVEKSSDPTSSCAPGLMKRVINYQSNISHLQLLGKLSKVVK